MQHMSEIILSAPLSEVSSPIKYLTRKDLADMFSVSVRTIENWRAIGAIPQSFSFGGRTYWDPEEIRSKVHERRESSATDAASTASVKIPALVGTRPPKAGRALAKSNARDERVLKSMMAA